MHTQLIRPFILAMVVLCARDAIALDPARSLTQAMHRIWQVQQGLPQGTIYCARQARDGYIWLGTRSGLVRFDGMQFTSLAELGASPTANLWVRDLAESSDGTLWVATEREGLFAWRAGRAQQFTSADGLPSGNVLALCVDEDDTLWIGTDRGLARLKGEHAETISTDVAELHSIHAISAAADGSIWAGGDGPVLAHVVDGQVTPRAVDSLPAATTVSALACGPDGAIWVGTSHGLVHVVGGNQRRYTTADGLSDNGLTCLSLGRDDSLWIGTNDGFNRLRHGEIDSFTTHEGLSQSTVYSICEDHEGSLWVGTKMGLNQFVDRRTTPFMTTEGLPSNNTGPIVEDSSGTIWVGTLDAGLARYDGRRFATITAEDGLPNNTIFALADGGDRLWVGSEGGLAVLERGEVADTWSHDDGLPDDSVRALCHDSHGALWIGTTAGLAVLRDDRISPVAGPSDPSQRLAIVAIVELRDSSIVVATEEQGLLRVERDRLLPFNVNLPAQTQASALFRDLDGTLLIGTRGDGIYLAARDKRLVHASVRDGLYDDDIFGITADRAGRLWLACSKGIFSVLQADLAAFAAGRAESIPTEPLSPLDALRAVECASDVQPAVQCMRDGRIWFATIRGVLVVDPSHWQRRLPPTPVRVEEVVINGKSEDPRRPHQLPPGVVNVSFRYAALSFTSPTRIAFRYRLDGFDADWVEAGSRREAFYTNLPPGQYKFRVAARNVDDKLYEDQQPVELVIGRRLYQSAWFLPLCAVAVAATGWAVYRLRMRQVRQRLAVVLAERSRIARELHDTLMQGFSGITMEMQALSTRLSPSPERSSLEEIIDDAGTCLREARRSIAGLRGDRSGLAAAISQAAQQIAEARDIHLRMHTVGIPGPLSQEVEYNLLRIAQEAVSNAVKHSGGRFIDVSLEAANTVVRLTIRDDGDGFAMHDGDPVGVGHYGLIGMRERASQIGADFQIESRPGRGTTVRITLPTRPAVVESAV